MVRKRLSTLDTSLVESIYRGFWVALDWIYPPQCVGCGEHGVRLCLACMKQINLIQEPICQKCGAPCNVGSDLCRTCRQLPSPYDELRSVARYEGVMRECIHAFKYAGNQSLGEFFSNYLYACVSAMNWEVDLVIPVPLSPLRQAERGYNQSALLARPLALKLGLRYQPFGLSRTRNTRSQVELSAQERQQNVIGAFSALPGVVQHHKVLLVDDVTTTGATLRECSLALRKAGANAIYCVTLARPVMPLDDLPIPGASSII